MLHSRLTHLEIYKDPRKISNQLWSGQEPWIPLSSSDACAISCKVQDSKNSTFIDPPLPSKSQDDKSYPIYAPKMNTIQIDKIRQEATIAEMQILEWLEDEKRYADLLRNIPLSKRPMMNSNLDYDELTTLLEAGIIEQTVEPPKAYCRIFFLGEEHKKRRRVIIEPRILNQCLNLQVANLTVSFASMDVIRKMVSETKKIYELDFKCFYYQIALAPMVRQYFCTRIGDKMYRVCRLPMGFSAAVSIAHSMSQIVSRKLCSQAFHEKIQHVVYIDNIYFLTADLAKDFDNAGHTIFRILDDFSVTVGTNGETDTILGVKYNTGEKTQALGEKWKIHEPFFERVRCFLSQPTQQWTPRILWKLFGVAVRWALVTQTPLANFFVSVRVLRRLARSLAFGLINWDETFTIEDEVERTELRLWCQEAQRNTPTRIYLRQEGKHDAEIFTDASDAGWGVVIRRVGGTTLKIVHGHWPEERKTLIIAEKEALALQEGVFLANKKNLKNPVFYVDNSACCAAVHKGLSANKIINDTVIYITKSFGPKCNVTFVPSGENLADAPSRFPKSTE